MIKIFTPHNASADGLYLRIAKLALVGGVTGLVATTFQLLMPFTIYATLAAFITALVLFSVCMHLRKSARGISSAALLIETPSDILQTDQLLENLPVALLRLNKSGFVEFANKEARILLGRDKIYGIRFSELVEGLGRSMLERLRDAANGKMARTSEMGRCIVDGQEVFLQVSLMQTSFVEHEYCIAVLTDKTELKTLEAQFVQSQKMEAVGQLAGGVAHDFNNLLTAINGHSDLLLLRHKSGDEDYGDLIQIRQNSVRAAALVRQLLAFSRKQTLRPKVVNLVDVLKELTQLLNRLLGEKVTLIIKENPDLEPVRVDVQQFEQVIMNLVVNARDSMPEGGDVTICTKNIVLEQPLERERAVVPKGEYVLVKVRDQGCGIDPDTLPKIFEPFFTTKRVGEGTGLGLSTVYGIIKQTGGFVFVTSERQKGTQFEIFLPVHVLDVKELITAPKKTIQPKPGKVSGHILLVEDEIPVRSFAARALKLKGYTVDEAGSGEEALEQLEKTEKPYDLFISDIIMPGLDGPSWILKAIKKGNNTKVIFVSGYSEDAFSESREQIEGAGFLAKPFSLTGLTDMVSETLLQD